VSRRAIRENRSWLVCFIVHRTPLVRLWSASAFALEYWGAERPACLSVLQSGVPLELTINISKIIPFLSAGRLVASLAPADHPGHPGARTIGSEPDRLDLFGQGACKRSRPWPVRPAQSGLRSRTLRPRQSECRVMASSRQTQAEQDAHAADLVTAFGCTEAGDRRNAGPLLRPRR
jgi:hypothetical protein